MLCDGGSDRASPPRLNDEHVWQAFNDVWAEIKVVVNGSKCEGYITGHLFE